MRTEVHQGPWVVVIPVPGRDPVSPAGRPYIGTGRDVVLQGFHWRSFDAAGNRQPWYAILRECAPRIKDAGFTWV